MEQSIHIWFWSHDSAFARVISRTLGPDFHVNHSDETSLAEIGGDEVCDVVLLDMRAGSSEVEKEAALIIKKIGELECSPPVVALVEGAEGHERDSTLQAMEVGAFDTVSSPPDMIELRLVLRRAYKYSQAERALSLLRSQELSGGRLHELIGASEGMQKVFSLAQKVSSCDVTVLITGETGTGKELLARAIHRLSLRSAASFIAFSCASLPETLVEDELFGHQKGAFTGALTARQGRFEAADHGTLFLDEIGDLGLGLQAKLLRVLQERSFERLGSNTPVTTDIRLICATHHDLASMVEEGKFRDDLYYRLNVVQLRLPPLRERRDDIPYLAYHFLRCFSTRFNKSVKRFSRSALNALEEYHWPGNVRELENVVQRAVAITDGNRIDLSGLPSRLRHGFEKGAPPSETYEAEVREFKRRLLIRALQDADWCKQEAARSLGLARSYLHRLINQLEIHPDDAFSAEGPRDDSTNAGPIM